MRRLLYAFWRRVVSRFYIFYLNSLRGISVGKGLIVVGLPSLQGRNITIGRQSVLVSLPLANPIGCYRPCILGTIESNSKSGKIKIGDRFSASGVCVYSQSCVEIGNDVMVGANVTIIDTDFHPISLSARKSKSQAKSLPVFIGDSVWIGMNAVILKGVSIGDGAVIGANCVVSSDVPEGAVVVNSKLKILGAGCV
ncbi:MAG: acyltransferase [Oceanobacter sp.]